MQVAFQERIRVCYAIPLAAVPRGALVHSQFVDFSGTSLFKVLGIGPATLDSPNKILICTIHTAPRLLEVPDWNEIVVLNLQILN